MAPPRACACPGLRGNVGSLPHGDAALVLPVAETLHPPPGASAGDRLFVVFGILHRRLPSRGTVEGRFSRDDWTGGR